MACLRQNYIFFLQLEAGEKSSLFQVYQGGIGSYALLVMVANLLLQHRTRIPNKKSDSNPILECNLGLLLLDFFRLYGRTLKQDDVAISCR
jgi:non-canonical poly(A) RNA polymerase PAPD5/7